MRFDVITLFPDLFAPFLDAGHHAPRLRVRAGSTCGCGRCATTPRAPTGASATTARSTTARAWSCWPSHRARAAPRSPPRAPPTARPRRRPSCCSRRPAAASTRRWCATGPWPRCDAAGGATRHRPARDRPRCRHRAEPRRLRALRRRAADNADAARRGRAPAARAVLGDEQSHLQDSFEQGPARPVRTTAARRCSRPRLARRLPVPPVLLSGHHADIARWRASASGADRPTAARPLIMAAGGGQLTRGGREAIPAPGPMSSTPAPDCRWAIILGSPLLYQARTAWAKLETLATQPSRASSTACERLRVRAFRQWCAGKAVPDKVFHMDLIADPRTGRNCPPRQDHSRASLLVTFPVIVNVNVVEGTRKRDQAYEGVVIARRNRGLNSNFIVPARSPAAKAWRRTLPACTAR